MTTKNDSKGNEVDRQPLTKREYIIDFPFKPRFRVSRSEIFYKNKTYSLSTVKHLFYEDIHVNQYTNGIVKSGTANVGRLGIIFDDAPSLILCIDETGPMHGLNWNKEGIINELRKSFYRLLDMTRDIRLSKYTSSIETHGCVDYLCGVKFFPDKVVAHSGKKEYLKPQYTFVRKNNVIYARKARGGGFFNQLLSLLNDPMFSLCADRDIINDVFKAHCSALLSGYSEADWVDRYRWSHPPTGRIIV